MRAGDRKGLSPAHTSEPEYAHTFSTERLLYATVGSIPETAERIKILLVMDMAAGVTVELKYPIITLNTRINMCSLHTFVFHKIPVSFKVSHICETRSIG